MREISTKKIEIGEHVLIDGDEFVAEIGSCGACEYHNYSNCDYSVFCPVGGKLTRVEKPTETQDNDTLMTNQQLGEWLAKGHGQAKTRDSEAMFSVLAFYEGEENEVVIDSLLIRPWGTDEWVKPTVGIYRRDCR